MYLSLPELEAILVAAREKEKREQRFMAALKGIDLDAEDDYAKEKFDEIKRRVDSKLSGRSEAELEMDIFGIEIETEE